MYLSYNLSTIVRLCNVCYSAISLSTDFEPNPFLAENSVQHGSIETIIDKIDLSFNSGGNNHEDYSDVSFNADVSHWAFDRIQARC